MMSRPTPRGRQLRGRTADYALDLERAMSATVALAAFTKSEGARMIWRAADARGDCDGVVQLQGLINHHRVVSLSCERGHAAADVPGQRLHLLERNGLGAPIAPHPRQGLEVELGVGRNHRQADTQLVAAHDQGLEHLVGGHPHLRCHLFGGDMIGVHLVLLKSVRDAEAIQQPGGVGLHAGLFSRSLRKTLRPRPDRRLHPWPPLRRSPCGPCPCRGSSPW